MQRRFTITGKREHIGQLSFLLHGQQHRFQGFANGLARREALVGASLGIEAAFTIDAVERANLSVCWEQVDA